MNPQLYKHPFTVAVMLVLLTLITLHPVAAAGGNPPRNNVPQTDAGRGRITTTGQTASFIVVFKDQVNTRGIGGKDRKDKTRNVLAALQDKANLTQILLRALLNSRLAEGRVSSFTPLWILNAIAITGDSSLITELATLPFMRTARRNGSRSLRA